MHQQCHWDHACAEDGQHTQNIDIREDTRLCLQALVEVQIGVFLSIRECCRSLLEAESQSMDGVHPLLAAADDILHEVCLVDLLMTSEHGRKERRSGRAADVARKIRQSGNVVVLTRVHAEIDHRIDRNEEER